MTVNKHWHGSLCIDVNALPSSIVIFGASGDLARRKLLPALFNLFTKKLLHENSFIVGFARTAMSDEQFKSLIGASLKKKFPSADAGLITAFLDKIRYRSGDYSSVESFNELHLLLDGLEQNHELEVPRLFFMSTPPGIVTAIVKTMAEARLLEESKSGFPERNVIIEKPFGTDLASAVELDRSLHKYLKEKQIYRIDHYLGKETVQNILMLRFANILFEPVWNSHYIKSVQITVAEAVGLEQRAGYFDKSGLLRDMFQNHILEMLSLVAMEPPGSFEADAVRNEKLKLINSIEPFKLDKLDESLIRAQYTADKELNFAAYRNEQGVQQQSNTETYVAARISINNWRWKGVPFYIRSGKHLGTKKSEIVINFKNIPHSIFSPLQVDDIANNTLVLTVQPDEGMALSIQAKQPGPKLCMGTLTMDFKYKDILKEEAMPDAYERLLLDCLLGDQTLFIRSDVIEASWRLFTPVLEKWREIDKNCDKNSLCPLYFYPAGSDGPEAANRLIKPGDNPWRPIN